MNGSRGLFGTLPQRPRFFLLSRSRPCIAPHPPGGGTNPSVGCHLAPITYPLLVLVLLLLPSPTGCRPSEPKADLVIINGMEPESLDPALATGLADMRIIGALFEGLTRLDPVTARAQPGLAASWNLSPDQRTYTFLLRSNITWSTGEPITSEDVLYSWRRALEPATAADYAGQLFAIKNAAAYNSGTLKDFGQVGIRLPNARTVQVELENPTPFFLDLCAFRTLAVVPRQAIERHGDRWLLARPLPVSGPYLLDSWRLNDKIRLRRNPLYWDAPNTGCAVVDLLPIGSATLAFTLYETGQADVVWDKELVPTDYLEVLLRRPDFHSFTYLGTYFLRFNVTRKPFTDPRVRKALALAVDKERITRKITKAGEKVAANLVPPGTANYSPAKGLDYNPDLARRLLAQAGYPGGAGFPSVRYLFNAAAGGAAMVQANIAVELQDMWQKELGIRIELRQAEWKVFLSAQGALDYDMCRSSWIGDYNDPNTFLDLFTSQSGNNRTGWKNPRYDELLRQAQAEPDRERRAALLLQAETLLVEEAVPIVPIYFYAGVNYFDTNKISGIHFNLLDEHPINAIRIKPGRGRPPSP